jgi:hypothetical protein
VQTTVGVFSGVIGPHKGHEDFKNFAQRILCEQVVKIQKSNNLGTFQECPDAEVKLSEPSIGRQS